MSPRLGLVLTDDDVLRLIRPATPDEHGRAVGRLDDLGARFVVLGLDPARRPRLEPAVAAQAIAALHPTLGVVVVAEPTRDHPYNLARRILSLDHLTRGRAGLVLAARRPAAAHSPSTTWLAGVSDDDTVEFARIVTGLWSTFPRDVVVTDRASRRFARSEGIRRLDHRGTWEVAGALTAPSSVQGRPPLLWIGTASDAGSAGADALLVIDPTSAVATVEALDPARGASSTTEPAPAGSLRDLLRLPFGADTGRGLEPAFASGGATR